jgi:arylsulfatase A-like enzyme
MTARPARLEDHGNRTREVDGVARKRFRGTIKLGIRDSTPDWDAFLPDKAPAGAPNVLVVLYDDTGLAAWSPYGGRIEMPTLQRLADNGLTYSQWHTRALCSPTRSVFLTGRNHHQNGFASISESSTGFPGYNSHIPRENATMATVLRDAGWSTFWVGKNHNTPVDAWTMGSSKKDWPLGLGYDRFYGFLGGDEPVVPGPRRGQPLRRPAVRPRGRLPPLEGHGRQGARVHPRLEAIGARQALVPVVLPGRQPRSAPRAAGVHRQVQRPLRRRLRGVPRMGAAADDREGDPARGDGADADQPHDPGYVQRGRLGAVLGHLSDEEKRLFSKMAEVYAAFSEYTDAQIGRIVDYLEESGQLENTLILYCADNGASGEGSPNGSVNEGRFFNAYPDSVEDNLELIDKLGSADTYNHYPTGWAVAFSTPFRMFKRYSQYQGGVCDSLVIHWPKGIRAKGEVRQQYHHCTDIVPTILECCGVEMPGVVDGHEQTPLPGVSMRYSFDDADAPTTKETQYYEMLGTRGIWHKGWKASAEHGPVPLGLGKFDQDRWQLFHTDEDRSEAHDLAEQQPDKLEELKALWLEEAERYDVLPLNDLGILEYRALEYQIAVPESGQYTYYPGTSEISEASAAGTVNVSYKILAEVAFTESSQGVIFAPGITVRRLLALREGREARVRLQLPRHPARAKGRRRRAVVRHPHRRSRVHERTDGRQPRADRLAQAPRGWRRRCRGRDPDRRFTLQPLRGRSLHRLRRRRRGQLGVQAEVRVHGRPDRESRLRRG